MSNPRKNVDALKIHEKNENGKLEECPAARDGTPFRWTGTVKQNLGKSRGEGNKQEFLSGEWDIEIQSPSLEETVFARANEEREAGEEVQFNLVDQGKIGQYEAKDGRVVGSTWFKQKRDHRTSVPGPWEDNREWREGMIHE